MDISSLNAIFGMSLYFYEESGSFFNEDGKPIPYTYQSGGKRDPNLHTKDPYICLGYDLSDFDSEQALLFTTDGSTYKTRDEIAVSDNRKHIRLRWLHLFENGNISVVSEASQLEGYEIRWYRYKMGAPSADEYSGVYWTAIEKTDDWFNYTLDPAPNTSVEQIKAIVLFDGKVIRSNILTFSNEKLVHTSIKQSTKKKIPSILINNLAAPNGLIITTSPNTINIIETTKSTHHSSHESFFKSIACFIFSKASIKIIIPATKGIIDNKTSGLHIKNTPHIIGTIPTVKLYFEYVVTLLLPKYLQI